MIVSWGCVISPAVSWYRKAAEAGISDSMNSLGVLLAKRGETQEAESWFRKAAEAGSSDAGHNLHVARKQRSQTRACLNCGAEMDKKGVCPVCDWRPGWLPIAQGASVDGKPNTTFAAERRHTFLGFYAFFCTLWGVIALVAGIAALANGNGAGPPG